MSEILDCVVLSVTCVEDAPASGRAIQGCDPEAAGFTPRGGSRWTRLLTGDVAHTLVKRADRPVTVLPDVDGED